MARRKSHTIRGAVMPFKNHPLTHKETIKNALRHHQAGNLTEAELLYRQVIDVDSDHPAANHLLGVIALQTGAPKAAVTLMEKSIHVNPGEAAAHQDLGSAYQNCGRLKDAALSFRQAIALDPTQAASHLKLGDILQFTGQLEEAATCFQSAIALQPRLIEAHFALGKTLRRLGKWTSALACLQTALAMQPSHVDSQIEIGVVLKGLGRTKEAIVAFRQASKLEPTNGLAQLYLSGIFNELGALQDALPHSRKAVEILPDHANAHNNLGCTLLDLANLNEAAACFRQAVKLQPDYHDGHNNLAIALQGMGRLEDAVVSYRESLKINPDQPTVQFNLAFVSHDLGRRDETRKAIRKGMELIPARPNQSPPSSHSAAANHPVALMHLPRSGSMFFHSLFDGHPEISTTPGVYLKGFFAEEVWEKLTTPMATSDPIEVLANNFCRHYDILFDARSPEPVFGNPFGTQVHLGQASGMTTLGKNRDQWLTLDRKAFLENLLCRLRKIEAINPRIFFQFIHEAYDQTLGRTHKKKAIFYHIHNPGLYETAHFLKWHPRARFLFLIRDPIKGLESWLAAAIPGLTGDDNSGCSESSLSVREIHHRLMRKIQNYFHYLNHPVYELAPTTAVRLEDIKRRPHDVMPSIARWIGVENDKHLYQSTFQDLSYWGPISNLNPDIRGFDTTNIDQNGKVLFSENDQFVFRTLFYPARQHFKYVKADEVSFEQDLKEVEKLLKEPMDFEKTLFKKYGNHDSSATNQGMQSMLRIQLDKIRINPFNQVGSYQLLQL